MNPDEKQRRRESVWEWLMFALNREYHLPLLVQRLVLGIVVLLIALGLLPKLESSLFRLAMQGNMTAMWLEVARFGPEMAYGPESHDQDDPMNRRYTLFAGTIGNNNLAGVRYLVEHGADRRLMDNRQSMLRVAVRDDHPEIVRYLYAQGYRDEHPAVLAYLRAQGIIASDTAGLDGIGP